MAWTCAAGSCNDTTLLYNGDCWTCDSHYCGRHLLDPDIHPCDGLDKRALMVTQSAKRRENVSNRAL
jgi:hypothetical protein